MGAAAGQERAAGRAAAGPGAGGRGRPGGAALPAASPGRASAGRCAAGEGRRRARGEGPPRPARGPAPGPRPRGCPRPAGERGDRGRPSGRSEGWARAGLEGGGTAGPPGRAPSPRRKRGAGGPAGSPGRGQSRRLPASRAPASPGEPALAAPAASDGIAGPRARALRMRLARRLGSQRGLRNYFLFAASTPFALSVFRFRAGFRLGFGKGFASLTVGSRAHRNWCFLCEGRAAERYLCSSTE